MQEGTASPARGSCLWVQDLCGLPGGGWGSVGAVKTLQSLDTPQLRVGTMWAEAGAQRHVERDSGRKTWCMHSAWLEWESVAASWAQF